MKSNLTCETCEPELIAYLDGQLHSAVARVLEAHLDGCAQCRTRLATYRTISTRLAAMPEIAPPAWLEARILGEVTGRARLRRFASRGLAAAAALSFAATIGLLAALPQIARQLGLPDPSTWPVIGVRALVDGVVALTKRIAVDLVVYEPLARQLWDAVRSLEALPRVILLALRTTEAQVAVALAITLGVALYLALRPSRTHQGGIGHACLSL